MDTLREDQKALLGSSFDGTTGGRGIKVVPGTHGREIFKRKLKVSCGELCRLTEDIERTW